MAARAPSGSSPRSTSTRPSRSASRSMSGSMSGSHPNGNAGGAGSSSVREAVVELGGAVVLMLATQARESARRADLQSASPPSGRPTRRTQSADPPDPHAWTWQEPAIPVAVLDGGDDRLDPRPRRVGRSDVRLAEGQHG